MSRKNKWKTEQGYFTVPEEGMTFKEISDLLSKEEGSHIPQSTVNNIFRRGLIKIANHGLTHCVLKGNLYLPRLFTSNRKYHREFWDWLPREHHFQHIKKSQIILEKAFGQRPEVLVPPGNVYSLDTLDAAIENGIKVVNCNTSDYEYKGLLVKSNKGVIAFHDKDIVEDGTEFLEQIINEHKSKKFDFIE